MSLNINFSYGDYDFRPRPLFSINSRPLKTPDGSGYGVNHNINLRGDILTTGNELSSGIVGVFDRVEQLKDALNADGRLLVVSCDDQPVLSGYPTISDFDINPESDNYTRRASYNISFEMPTTVQGTGNDNFNNSSIPPFIESCEESWDVEFQDERMPFEWTLHDGTIEKFGYTLLVNHVINVSARIAYTGSEISNIPWEDAKTYASGKLGFNNEFVELSGILGTPGVDFDRTDVYNQYRQVSTDKTNGNIQVTETFIVTPSGTNSLPNNAIETFDINTNQNDGVITVSINGEIRGLAEMSYASGIQTVADKFSAASGYYNLVKDRLFDRAKTVYSTVTGNCFNRSLNPTVRSRSVGMNPIEGVVTYDYQYDTIPSGCITGSCIISQNITIDDNLPTDVFAKNVVLGRAVGPILQDIGTITERVRTVNIELVTLPPVSCSTISDIYEPIPRDQIDDFVEVISGDLSNNYDQVFVSNNSENWNFTNGRYTKSIGFTYTNCSGS